MKLGIKGLQGWLAVGLFLLALLFAFTPVAVGAMLLALIGLVLGFTAVTSKERVGFLIAALVLAVIGAPAFLAGLPQAGAFINAFLANLFVAFAPAAVVVAIWHLWDVSKSK